MRHMFATLAAAGLIGASVGAAGAAQLSQQDQQFMKQAAQGGMEEVQTGQLAEQKAAAPAVKQLGQTLVTDHTQLNNQLMQLAQQQGVTLPTTLDQSDRQEMQQLQKLSGSQFDKTFAKEEIEDHQKMIKMFQQEAQNTQDQALRQWVETGIPVLQKHLQMAQQAESAG